MTKKIYLFRHGETVWSEVGKIQGQVSSVPLPLTEFGENQAKNLAEELKDKGIKFILSSDLLRAKQTAEFVAETTGAKVEYDKRLRETNYGLINGKYRTETDYLFPGYSVAYENHEIPFPQGEKLDQVEERMRNAIKDACKNTDDDVLAISSHGNSIKTFYSSIIGKQYKKMGNCEFIVIEYDEINDKFIKTN